MSEKPTYEELEQQIQELEQAEYERKQAEEKLKESEERYRTIFKHAPIGINLVDKEGRPLYVNPALQEMLGYSENEFRSMVFADYTHPDDVGDSLKLVRSVLDGESDLFDMEKQYYRKDGSLMWAHTTVSAVRDANGEFQYFITMVEDITERKQAEEALRESEGKYRQLFNTGSDAIMVFDAKTLKFVDVNDSALSLYGYTREEFLKLRQPAITAEPEESEASIKETLAGKLVRISMRYHKKKDGTIFPVEISVGTFMLKNRKVLFGVIRDITERKLAEEVLNRSNEELLKEHNQRVMLSKSLIELLEKDRRQVAMELHDHIGQTLTSLKELFNEIQQQTDMEIHYFSRGIPERFEEEKELAIYRIAQEALSNIVRHARAKNVFVNLVKKDENLSLSVEDDGVGFDQDRAMKPSKKKVSLGLLIMKERAVQLDGEFTIESQIGKGTHLLVEIPL